MRDRGEESAAGNSQGVKSGDGAQWLQQMWPTMRDNNKNLLNTREELESIKGLCLVNGLPAEITNTSLTF